MKKEKKIIIIGGGFKGLIAALKLSNKGHNVNIIEASKNIGGYLNSPLWNKITIDLGCHLFINEDDNSTGFIMSMLKNDYMKVDVNYASFFNNKKTDNIAIPDFSSIPNATKRKIQKDLLNINRKKIEEKSLMDYYINRYGVDILPSIDSCILKSHLIKSNSLDIISKNLLPFNRIKIFPEKQSVSLKLNKGLDEIIAVKYKNLKEIKNDTKKSEFNFREYYPKKNGLKFLLNKIIERLKKSNVNLVLDNRIKSFLKENNKKYIITDKSKYEYDYLYWSAPQYLIPKTFNFEIEVEKFVHSVPYVLIYFLAPKKFVSKYTYVHNYNLSSKCFRVSIQSNYASNGVPKDLALICCEIPTCKSKRIWKNPKFYVDEIWNELLNMDLVSCKKYDNYMFFSIPSAYKLPLCGYSDILNEAIEKTKKYNLIGGKSWEYSKNDIMKKIDEDLKFLL